MKREISQYLLEWKERSDRKPLIIRGARQVGKTYTVESFARQCFKNLVKINLEEKPEFRKLFDKNDTKLIINEISILLETDFEFGTTLLFLDEIQTSPNAIRVLRYFYEQMPELHVIAAGSLLDLTLNEIQYSMPVGRVEFCYMYPLSFLEFLDANAQPKLAGYIKNYDFKTAFSPVMHDKIIQYLRLYFFIGGMPEAVKTYINTNKLSDVERVHSSIITSLIYDFAKYGTRKQQENMIAVFKYAANNTGRKIKYVHIDKETRSTFLKEAFFKLEMSRVLYLVRHTNVASSPVNDLLNNNVFKPVFLDIGLANHIGNVQLIDIENLITHNEGMLAEQFVGQELISSNKPFTDSKLFYWMRQKKNANAEIDYLLQHKNRLYPVEVKAGKTGTLKSLHQYLYEKKLKTGIRFNLDKPSIGNFSISMQNIGANTSLNYNLISLPLYLSSVLPNFLENEQQI